MMLLYINFHSFSLSKCAIVCSLSKLLRETVECYGNTRDQEEGPFWSGVNRLLVVSSFAIRLCSPTSTSKTFDVAKRFASENGIVMQLNNDEDYLRCFDCSILSAHFEEDERLFFGGDWRTRVESVIVVAYNMRNYVNYFRVFHAFDLMLSGADLEQTDKQGIRPKDEDRLSDFIEREIRGDWSYESYPYDEYTINTFNEYTQKKRDFEYMMDTFNEYTRNNRDIVINLSFLNTDFPEGLYKQIVHCIVDQDAEDYQNADVKDANDEKINMIRWHHLFDLFPSLETLTIHTTDQFGLRIFPFSLKTALSILRDELFEKSKSIKCVRFIGVHHSAAVASAMIKSPTSREDGHWSIAPITGQNQRSWIWNSYTAMKAARTKTSSSKMLLLEADAGIGKRNATSIGRDFVKNKPNVSATKSVRNYEGAKEDILVIERN